MTALSIQPTYPIFTDAAGEPLENGYIWIGTANLDPQANPINVYWDAALTQLAAQPIRTLGGYPSNSGTPARLYVNSDYSIRVMNKNGSVVYSAPAATERLSDVVVGGVNASEVVYDPSGTGAVATTVQTKLRETVSVKDFGATGDGVTDDTAAIQAAIAYAATYATAVGQAVYFPRGDYLYSSLTISAGNVHLVGDGDARLIKSGTTGDGLTIKSTGARIYGNKVTGLVFASANTGVSGRLIYCENVGQITIKDIVITSFPAAGYRGVEFYKASQTVFGAAIQNCVERGFYARDCVDVTAVPGSRSDSNGSHGWEFDTCSGVYFTDVTAYWNNGNGFRLVGTIVSPILATAGNSFQFHSGCIADSSGSDNWFISSLIKSTLTGCWGSTQKNTTADLSGFVVTGCVGVDLNGLIAMTNNAMGLHITGGSNNIQVRGGRFDGNGKQAGSARREGVVIATSTSTIMDGVIMTDTQVVKTQQYGLRVQAIALLLTISNCNMDGNVIYPYAFDAIPTNFNESNNYTAEPVTVASAGTVFLPNFGRVFVITGTTNINALGNQWRGRQVTLVFQGALTVGDTGSLVLAGNFTTTADDTLTLISDGVNWYEVSRSVN
jgi:hypothetical protein